MNADLRSLHLSGKLVPFRWDLQPVYTMVDAGAWDAPCRDALAAELKQDDAAGGLVLMFFGAHFTTEPSTVDAICNSEILLSASKRRLGSGVKCMKRASCSRKGIGSVWRADCVDRRSNRRTQDRPFSRDIPILPIAAGRCFQIDPADSGEPSARCGDFGDAPSGIL
jgi:hypothetical protein